MDYLAEIKRYSFYKALKVPKRYRMPKRMSEADVDIIRDLQSYYTNLFSYLLTALGQAKVARMVSESVLDAYQKQLFIKLTNKKGRKTKEYIYSQIKSSTGYQKRQIRYLRNKMKEEIYSAWVLVVEKMIATASREQTFRQLEIEKYFGRGGQGTGSLRD